MEKQKVAKIFKRITILSRGFTAVLLALLTLICFGSQLAFANKDRINAFLGLTSSKMIDTGESGETDYFKSDYAVDVNNPTTAELAALKEATKQHSIQEMEEGAVLLKNNNDALPLKKGANVSLFGHASVDPLYKPYSGSPSSSGAVDILTAMQQAGFNVNTALYNYYKNAMDSRTYGSGRRSDTYLSMDTKLYEPDKSFYRSEVRATYNGYKDAAIVFLARVGGEDSDLPTGRGSLDAPGFSVDEPTVSYLALQPKERDMLEEVKSAGFEKIIVVLNIPNPMELAWLDEYDVDAALWVAGAGHYGFIGMANILNGDANPSGRVVDTYAANSLSAPAVVNYGNFQYSNASLLNSSNGISDPYDKVSNYIVYAEGIYTGYRYYETRYEDTILGSGGANSTVGSSKKDNAWNYADEVVYPFGYGLSYTTFTQELVSGTYDAKTKTFNIDVKVTNTGDVAGKNSVLLYVQTPYINGGVEKSAIQLVGFAKTKTLNAGETQTVSISVDKYLLASYDEHVAKGYILDAGKYYFAVGNDVHDALNYVLKEKGRTGMVDHTGTAFSPASENKIWVWELAKLDDTTYKYSQYNEGVQVTNRFDEFDLNYWIKGGVTYLSRSDWKNTYPTKPTTITLTQEMIKEISGYYYEKPADAPAVSDFTQGAKNGLTFVNMKDVPYEDDETWNKFLDQLTVDDMLAVMIDSAGSPEIESVSKPYNYNNDGPDGINGGYKKFNPDGSKQSGISGNCTMYPNEIILAATFNYELMAEKGRLLGEESMFATCPQIWSPGANYHRTPFCGRNFEYFSEDPIHSYLCLSVEVKAMREKGVISAIKHFVGNNQEINRMGLATFTNEQTFRQNDMKAFEGGFTIGGSLGTMTAFNRVGLRTFTQNKIMNTDILRGEWGFKGVVISDAWLPPMHPIESLIAGTDMCCFAWNLSKIQPISQAIKNDGDGYLLMKLREANKHYYYAYCNSNLVNGLSSTMKVVSITNWWETLLTTSQTCLIVLTSLSAALFVGSSIYRVVVERKKES